MRSHLRAIGRGILLRCPVCGRGRLFAGYDRIMERCAVCETVIEASPGEWTGALMFAQGGFGLLALGGWYVMFLLGIPSFGLLGITWLVGWGIGAPLLLYRSLKGAWIGLMHASGGLDAPGENTRP